MKVIQKLIDERYARIAARFMTLVCYLAILVLLLALALSVMGRLAFCLHTGTASYDTAIYAEKNHNPNSRGMIVHMNDDIYVWANDDNQIDPVIQIGLSLMFAVSVLPVMFALWFLSRVFVNVSRGQIFTEQNAFALLYYGLLQLFAAIFPPFIKLFIAFLVNLFADGRIAIATGKNIVSGILPNIAFLVAAYIIHYGIHLQDEVDHTL